MPGRIHRGGGEARNKNGPLNRLLVAYSPAAWGDFDPAVKRILHRAAATANRTVTEKTGLDHDAGSFDHGRPELNRFLYRLIKDIRRIIGAWNLLLPELTAQWSRSEAAHPESNL